LFKIEKVVLIIFLENRPIKLKTEERTSKLEPVKNNQNPQKNEEKIVDRPQ
jgi:hypothetical protein